MNCSRWNSRFAPRRGSPPQYRRQDASPDHVALGEETDAALPGCQAELVRVAGSRIVIGYVLIGRCDVRANEAIAEHAFECDETAGRYADAIDVETRRARDRKAPHRRSAAVRPDCAAPPSGPTPIPAGYETGSGAGRALTARIWTCVSCCFAPARRPSPQVISTEL